MVQAWCFGVLLLDSPLDPLKHAEYGLKVGGHEAVADLGGSILTGIDGNPLAVLAKQLRIPMHEIEQTQVSS